MTTRWDVTRAVRRSSLPAPARLLMFVLADVADVGTAEIPSQRTPSVTVLEAETGLGRSTIQRHLADLEAQGWIVRTRPSLAAQAQGARVRYALRVPSGVVPQRDRGGPAAGPGVVSERDTGGVTAGPLDRCSDQPLTPPGPPEADPAVVAEPQGEGDEPIQETPEDPTAVVARILAIRPEWTAAAIRAALAERSVRERPWPIVAAAAELMAADPRSTSPGRLRTPGPWWSLAASQVRSRQPTGPPGGQVVAQLRSLAERVETSDPGRIAAARAAARQAAAAARRPRSA